jgi:DNA glycosylase AlkZ-like
MKTSLSGNCHKVYYEQTIPSPMNPAINEQRLNNQCLTKSGPAHPAEVVAWLGAVQAQEFTAAKWALALRMANNPTDADIQRAFDEGMILRTHVMRPTWHFVTPTDIHWMRELTAPRVRRVLASYDRNAGLSTSIRGRANAIFERVFRHNEFPTRTELRTELKRSGIEVTAVQLAVLTIHAEVDGLMCSGPRRGRNLTYALLERRVPMRRHIDRDEALAELTRRYFRSHGPATIRDFVWWSGLTTTDAKRGLEINKARCELVNDLKYWTVESRATCPVAVNRTVHLLPVYDEYFVAYRDRAEDKKLTQRAGQVTSQNALIAAGERIGIWKTVSKSDGLTLDVTSWRPLSKQGHQQLSDAAATYGRFLGVSVSLLPRYNRARS